MTRTALTAFVATCGLSLSSCGTICNLADKDPQVYGGVQKEIEFVQKPGHMGPSQGSGRGVLAIFLLLPAEACLTLAGDTLTLPVVVCLRQNPAAPGEQVYYYHPEQGPTADADNLPSVDVPMHQPRPITFEQLVAVVQECERNRQQPEHSDSNLLNPIPQDAVPWNPVLPDPALEGSLPLLNHLMNDLAQSP
jgi:hypothetical protein